MHSLIEEHSKRFSALAEMQKEYENKKIMHKLFPVHKKHSPFFISSIKKFAHLDLSQFYCPDGTLHNWKSWIFKGAQTKEFSKRDILQLNEKQYLGFIKMEVVDERCAKCKTLLSRTKKSDIKSKLIKIDKLDAFYTNYQNRCPKGDLHEIKNNKCKKCGFSAEYFIKKDRKYYDKFRKQFDKVQKEKIGLLKIKDHKPKLEKLETFPKWKITNSKILEFAKKFNINPNFMFNIGLNENKLFTDVMKNKVNRYITSDDDAIRVQNNYLINYILMMFEFYYTLKNHNKIVKMPPELEKIYQKSDYNLPDINNKFNEKVNYYRDVLTPKEFSNFLLNFLSDSFLFINKKMEKTKQKKMIIEFTKMIMKKIESAERAISKPKKLKFADKGDAPLLVESSSYDNTVEEVEIESLDSPDVEKNPFVNDMDIEDDDNLEGDTGDWDT